MHSLDHVELGYPGRGLLTKWIDGLHPEVRHRLVSRAPSILHCEQFRWVGLLRAHQHVVQMLGADTARLQGHFDDYQHIVEPVQGDGGEHLGCDAITA